MRACVFCDSDGLGERLWSGERFRIVHVEENELGFPVLLQLIWNAHVKEMSELSRAEREEIWTALDCLERAMRMVLQPDKMNLASFGNVVPHLHWHVIARYETDSHFPAPIWANAKRQGYVGLPNAWREKVIEQFKAFWETAQRT